MVGGVRVGLRYSGVKLLGCPRKFQHLAEQNVIGSARIAWLCFMRWEGGGVAVEFEGGHAKIWCVKRGSLTKIAFKFGSE